MFRFTLAKCFRAHGSENKIPPCDSLNQQCFFQDTAGTHPTPQGKLLLQTYEPEKQK